MVTLITSTAAKLGFSSVAVNALLEPGSQQFPSHNGAYTFARLGFDCILLDELIDKLPPDLKGCKWLAELVGCPAGVEFWRRNARTTPMEFDLSKNSRSWVVLKNYLDEKNIRIING